MVYYLIFSFQTFASLSIILMDKLKVSFQKNDMQKDIHWQVKNRRYENKYI